MESPLKYPNWGDQTNTLSESTSKTGRGRQSSALSGSRIEVKPSESKLKEPPTFRPYQIRWANDTSRLAFIVKATQIGISTATAGWAIFKRCLRIPGHLVIILSRSVPSSIGSPRFTSTASSNSTVLRQHEPAPEVDPSELPADQPTP